MIRLQKSRITETGPMRFVAFLSVFAFLFAYPAFAACYSPLEAEAEQGIRIHSELLVIALTCQHRTPQGQENLYVQYKKFTNKHGKVLAGYENALMNNYKASGSKDAEADINALRTNFANKISNDAARMRPDKFCNAFLSRVPKASKMSDTDFRKWASVQFKGHPVSKPICASAKK